MINIAQFRQEILTPALSLLKQYSADAMELLVFTCATESKGGTYLRQIKGPALGIFQMEPFTYNDIWQNYIRKKNDISLLLGTHFNAFSMPDERRMIHDLFFATAMARIFYLRIPAKLPNKEDIDGIWEYYKEYYNTEHGKATKDESIKAYYAFIGGKPKKQTDEKKAHQD
jgi:hypothetical protein